MLERTREKRFAEAEAAAALTETEDPCRCGKQEGVCWSSEHGGALRTTFWGNDEKLHVRGAGAGTGSVIR